MLWDSQRCFRILEEVLRFLGMLWDSQKSFRILENALGFLEMLWDSWICFWHS